MGRRQPEVEGKQGTLQHQAGEHQQRGNAHGPRCRGVDERRQGRDRYRAVGAVDQRHAQQVGTGTQQCRKQVTQCRGDLRGRTAGGDQRDGGKPDDLERHVEIEDVVRQVERIHAGNEKAGERPEMAGCR